MKEAAEKKYMKKLTIGDVSDIPLRGDCDLELYKYN